MDASGAVYYPPFPNDDNDQGGDQKRCSVRGCPQLVTDGSQNKMCDSCRGRHRIYASTKRARRKLEKAAVTNAVAARNGLEHMLLVHESSPVASTSTSAWVPPSVNGQRLPEVSV
ncbi:hypothetical protein GALMADRAFT_764803 [Galerina marginata CBS 339.88]|uniref:Uncharacterized protein n=1 Tax=Galerina marginata (strain CBS 339.88) TaxID=685588 RepID=A0A067SPC2_GALM3|nr:hypothetical protein GALMADRAFT_764803 [Galerina marginata CBS 339.88]